MLKKLTAWDAGQVCCSVAVISDSATPGLCNLASAQPPHKMSNLNPYYLGVSIANLHFTEDQGGGLERSRILPRVSCEMGDGDAMQKSHPARQGRAMQWLGTRVVTREQAQ